MEYDIKHFLIAINNDDSMDKDIIKRNFDDVRERNNVFVFTGS